MFSHNVILAIRSIQTIDGQASPPVEVVTHGLLRRVGQELILTYEEGQDSGMEGVRTTLRSTPEQVILLREGPWQAQMVFRMGPPQDSRYVTPYGAIPMRLHTRRLRSSLSETGGKLELEYDMELSGQNAGTVYFLLTVRETCPGSSQTKEKR